MKDFSYHDHDPHEVDYNALKQENDLPFPELDPKDFDEWWQDFFHKENNKMDWYTATRLAFRAGQNNAINILRQVMEWIENWEPEFTDDPEWEVLERRVKKLLKGK